MDYKYRVNKLYEKIAHDIGNQSKFGIQNKFMMPITMVMTEKQLLYMYEILKILGEDYDEKRHPVCIITNPEPDETYYQNAIDETRQYCHRFIALLEEWLPHYDKADRKQAIYAELEAFKEHLKHPEPFDREGYEYYLKQVELRKRRFMEKISENGHF